MSRVIVSVFFLMLLLLAGPLLWWLMRGPDPIPVGMLGAFTGRFAELGLHSLQGARLAITVHNRQHPQLPIVLLPRDTGGNPEAAMRQLRELALDDQVTATLGPLTTASTTSARQVANQLQHVLISGSAAGENLVGLDDFLIRCYPSTKTFGLAFGHQLAERQHRQIAALYDTRNRAFADTMLQGLQEGLGQQAWPGRLHELPFTSGLDLDRSPVLNELDSHRVSAVLIIASAPDTIALAREIRARFPTMELFSSPWGVDNALLRQGGPAVEGLLFLLPYRCDDSSPAYRQFLRAYRQEYQEEPAHVAITSYTATRMLCQVLQEQPGLQGPALRAAILRRGSFIGLQHLMQVDRFGDTEWPLYPHTIQHGRLLSLDP